MPESARFSVFNNSKFLHNLQLYNQICFGISVTISKHVMYLPKMLSCLSDSPPIFIRM